MTVTELNVANVYETWQQALQAALAHDERCPYAQRYTVCCETCQALNAAEAKAFDAYLSVTGYNER